MNIFAQKPAKPVSTLESMMNVEIGYSFYDPFSRYITVSFSAL